MELYSIFENIAKNNTEQMAVIFENREISFGQLLSEIEQARENLVSSHVNTGDTVVLHSCKSMYYCVYALALLQLNCTVVPVMENTPSRKYENMLKVCQPQHIVEIRNNANPCIVQRKDYLQSVSKAAYILFTSGTTGEPKGVEITHKGLSIYLMEAYKNLEYENTSRHLSCCAYSFDVHFTEIFIPLFHGKTVVIANDEESHNPRLLMKLIEQHNVDTIWITPSKMKWLLAASRKVVFPTLKNIFFAGEVLDANLFEQISHIKAQIWNAYGPTEATNYVTIKKIVDKNSITIGYSVPWCKIIICDQDFNNVNVGSTGEICIISETLSSGYCNNPEVTQKSFICSQTGEKLYRTGDFGYQDEKGEIYYIGRMDRQIKLYGHRLELDGIEAHLHNHTNVTQCGAYYNKDTGKIIILYTGNVEANDIQEYLSTYIDIYSLPNCIAHVSEYTYNTNGKIDRQATYQHWLNEHE
nr:AMP-binding protein [uncultured Lachnoclostridium sp.]